jgi:hypothetical protein
MPFSLAPALLLFIAPPTNEDIARIDKIYTDLQSIPAGQLSDQHRETASKLFNFYHTSWLDCVQKRKIELQNSKESPQDIATTVLSLCSERRSKVRGSLTISWTGVMPTDRRDYEVTKMMNDDVTKMRDILVAYIVKFRHEANAPKK